MTTPPPFEDLYNRIRKRFTHIKKWAKREDVSCFRVYARDLIDYPLVIDWLDGDAVLWLHPRKKDDTDTKQDIYEKNAIETVQLALNLNPEQLYVKYRKKQKGLQNQYSKLSYQEEKKIVTENGLRFELNLSDYLDTGLFLDHRKTRALSATLAKKKHVLNLFAYTGAFSVYAASPGAKTVTTVDMNPHYIDWAKRNFTHNNIPLSPSYRFLTDNCLEFLKHEKSRKKYDLIICDPPTFSNSKKMSKTFSINEDYAELINDCIDILSDGGVLLFSTNSSTFKLDAAAFPGTIQISEITQKTQSEDFKNVRMHRCWKLIKPSSH